MTKIKQLSYKYSNKKVKLPRIADSPNESKKPLYKIVAQKRAIESLKFGINIKHNGYHIYAMGPIGISKRAIVTSLLEDVSRTMPIPHDWCYIYNFDNPEKPQTLKCPAGIGVKLNFAMDNFLRGFSKTIINLLEKQKVSSRNKKTRTEKEIQNQLITHYLKPKIRLLKKKFNKHHNICKFLDRIKIDITQNISDIIKEREKINKITLSLENILLTKYKINLLVNNSKLTHAPIIFQESPSYATLFTRIEYTLQQGVLTTNFTLIKPGDLHLANGGFLLIEADKMKRDPELWELLKSALYSGKIKLKPISHEVDPMKPISLEPTAIPLNIKIILLGNRNTYYSLCDRDADFLDLFKVMVDFDEEIKLNRVNLKHYISLIKHLINKHHLKPFDDSAYAELIEQSSRLAEDAEKLTTHIREIENLMQEANYWARENNQKSVTGTYVKKAVEKKIMRLDRAREAYYDDIFRNFIIIKTQGYAIGQVNCLSVRRVGNFAYGHPTRVTARVRVGRGKLLDIQRESNMAGSLHKKASLTIANFLASRFNQSQPFALHASLSFEQVYCWTDGDSASVGELCALLSALANIPLSQSLAVTGSLDQYGNVQAVGGVNEKIEGFYDVCKLKNSSAQHGVIIPYVNVKNLILKKEVIRSTKRKEFVIYPIKNIDEAITLLLQDNVSLQYFYQQIIKKLDKFIASRRKHSSVKIES